MGEKSGNIPNRPIKKWRSGNISGALWFNERQINDGTKVGFKTISIRRSWKDKEKDIWRDETINMRRQDLPKIITILNQMMEELYLVDEDEE
ncbi:hypothetical protein K8R47_01720 [archaeon]|nr:hypothetical protein [archaeon]